ncbi:MAG TPA: PP2C family protein-serine/threonine phosphatase [Bryobacteraceae bacterium]|nr:PP2C family protein-serine/threonine phosphatase [Bryobacteraceae bacterium]
MEETTQFRYFWFKASIVLGVLLGLVLLVQSVLTYRFVASNMVRIEAKREADRKMQALIRSSRLAGRRDTITLHPVMDELITEAPQQIAWMRILDLTGKELAVSGKTSGAPSYDRSKLDKIVEDRDRPADVRETGGGPVLITLNPLFVGTGRAARGPRGTLAAMPGVGIVEIAIYLNGVSTRFGPLRQNLIVGCSAAFALLAAVIVIGIRFRNYLRGKQVEEQLAMARRVQFDLLPPGKLLTHDLEFAAQCVPAWQVGGDLYDAFETDDHKIALVLGDVSGKGLSAALLMGVVQGAVHASSATGPAANHEQSAERLNQLLCMKTARERFVSLVWCYFDPAASMLSYINAGHLPALLVRQMTDGKFEVQHLNEGGPVLGVLPGATYRQSQIAILPGDLLVVFSDGIFEAVNASDQEFGEERILDVVKENWTGTPTRICDAVLAQVRGFLGKALPHDDQTLMIVRLQGAARSSGEPGFEAAPAELPLLRG